MDRALEEHEAKMIDVANAIKKTKGNKRNDLIRYFKRLEKERQEYISYRYRKGVKR